jgi:gliding motility-associated-like protein
MRKLYPFLLVFATMISSEIRSQLVVDSLSIEEYVQDVLLGSGIQATNISYTGCFEQIGYMHEGGTVGLGINGGVVLSSDHSHNIEVPSPGLWLGNGGCLGSSGDTDLLSIANSVPPMIGQSFSVSSVNDMSILEFDFVPTGDTLRFNYIFGSDEYLTWVNSSFNDIFAFLLSGPGITGPYDSPAAFPNGAVNIAQVPGSDPPLPITISSVNNVLNSAYYIDNQTNQNISINGYTVVLEAMHPVTCGETYHIKLAIADGTDTALESIVILEEGSFSSNSVVDVALSINVGGPDANIIYEDCGEATLTFTRAEISSLEVEDMVVVTWNGTAEMGLDYNILPDTIVFPIGVSSVTFSLDAIEDAIGEGIESVEMDILNLAACNGSGMVSNFSFNIGDEPEPLVVEGYDTEICQGDIVTLEPIITGGYGNFHYDWSTAESTPTIDVEPLATTTYFLTVSDTCGMPSDEAQFEVGILVYPPLTIDIPMGDQELACGESIEILANATGGDGVYTYYWYNQDDQNLWGWGNSLWYSSWNGGGQVFAQVTDGCGFTAVDSINVNLNVPELIVTMPTEMAVPCNSQFTVTAATTGGMAPYWYTWSVDGVFDWWQSTETFTTMLAQPASIQVSVSDQCGQSEVATVEVTIDSPPIEIVMDDILTGTCNDIFNIQPTVSGGSGSFVYQWSNNNSIIGSNSSVNFSSAVDTEVNLFVSDACGATAEDLVVIDIENPELFVDLGEDINASCIDNTEIVPTLSGGSGGNQYSWVVNDAVESNDDTFTYQTYETVNVTVNVSDACGMTASDVVTIIIPDVPIVMTASPDTAICVGGTANIWALAEGGEGGFTYTWTGSSTSGNSADVSPAASQHYTVVATDVCGDYASTGMIVTVMPIEADFTAVETAEDFYEFVSLPNPICDNCTYAWDFGDGDLADEANTTHEFDGLSDYLVSLLIVNEIGCSDIAYYTVQPAPLMYIPSAFTPNGDGINDVFKIVSAGVMDFEITIFNRWGDVVFTSNDPNQVWLGDTYANGSYFIQDGMYQYRVKVKGYNSEAVEKTGTIQLMR